MIMQKITPFLWFDNQAEAAVNLYTSLFKNSRIEDDRRSNDPGAEASGQAKGSIMSIAFELAGLSFIAFNGGPYFSFTPAVSFFVSCATEAEITSLWSGLAEGGSVLMALDQYPFSARYGWLNDRFGVSWQLYLDNQMPEGAAPQIMPFLMFVGPQAGQAEAAINFYSSLFKDSGLMQIERYQSGEGDVEGTIKHARFKLAGQAFGALDSSLDHAFNFTPAISFFVSCDSQEEVDVYWIRFTTFGEAGQCGWLTDHWGVSWQIVPTELTRLLNDPDPARAERVMSAMLAMKKIDIAGLLEAADRRA
jgi:predicted 3-demethylubiquinone-9 3-methyltransferase (glyoxalase superfamily)